MSRKTPQSKARKVVVSTRAPEAREVFVAGSFNGWEPGRDRMSRGDGGDWTATLSLAPGTYEYKFVVDGRWCCNPQGDEPSEADASCVRNGLGTMNRVLVVGEPATGARRLESSA